MCSEHLSICCLILANNRSRKSYRKKGSSIFKLNPKLRNGLLSVGGRPESTIRFEASIYPSQSPPCHRAAYPASPQESGPPWSRICSLIPEGKVLDCERRFCSVPHVEQMSLLPEEESAYWRAADGQVA